MNRWTLALLPLLASLLICGCSNSPDNSPPPSAMNPTGGKPVTPIKPPSTKEEKIQAIQNSSLPEDQKKAAIERVNSGQL